MSSVTARTTPVRPRRPGVTTVLLALPVPALILVLWTLGVQQAWVVYHRPQVFGSPRWRG